MQNNRTKETAKKAYTTPSLVEYGRVTVLTQGMLTGGFIDAGGMMFMMMA